MPASSSEARERAQGGGLAPQGDLEGIRGPGGGVAELAGVFRGLSALFWGLPLALLAFARHFLAFWLSVYDLLLPVAAAACLWFGVSRMRQFQPGERVWQRSVLVTELLSVLMVGLAPFLYLWSRLPAVELYARAVLILVGVSFGFLVALTGMLARLSAMLPDETARADARLFHGLARYVVVVLAGAGLAVYLRLRPASIVEFLSLPYPPQGLLRQAILLLLVLVPVAMAMAVAWKLKEVVLAVVVGARSARGG